MPRKSKKQKESEEVEKDLAASYDAYKEFEGKRYTGMKVGGHHKWHDDSGVWKERKVSPDRWEFTYAVAKRRAGHAPKGSGVPVGTEYHWYLLAHQTVRKLDENTYTTSTSGLKYKLAHKRADAEKWSSSQGAQKRRLVKILQEMIEGLEEEDEERENPLLAAHPDEGESEEGTGPAEPPAPVRQVRRPARRPTRRRLKKAA